MKIEDYNICANVKFHDIRKQGYTNPVEYNFAALKHLIEYISDLPLVRGHFTVFTDLFTITFNIGFKTGSFYATPPIINITNFVKYFKPPLFTFQGKRILMYGAIGFQNKEDYVVFLQAICEYAVEVRKLCVKH